MARPRKPAEGGAVTETSIAPQVRGPIKEMLAGGTEDDFKDSLPEKTSTEDQSIPEGSQPRKKRRTKEEMAKERGEGAPVDRRLERARNKAAGLGGAKVVEAGFRTAGAPLDDEEKEDIEDQFYLISVKAGLDPSGSWFFVIAYTIVLIAQFIMVRTDLGEQVKALLTPKEKEESKEKKEEPKAA